jgi:hypothetical protein
MLSISFKQGHTVLKIKKLNNAGITHLFIPILVICLIAAAGSYMVFRSSASLDGTANIDNLSVQLGREELVMGPTNITDNGFFMEQDSKDNSFGYVSNTNTYSFPLNDRDLPIVPKKESEIAKNIVLANDPKPAKGTPARAQFDREEAKGQHPDSCGAWMLSAIYSDPKKEDRRFKIAWYHAEDRCDYDNGGQTHMTTSFITSDDDGKTWKKPGYPNNQIVTADKDLQGNPATDDTANGRIIRDDTYFYFIYGASSATTTNQISLARSKVSDGGRPGTWWKWYCNDGNACQFTDDNNWKQPGIGGKTTTIKGISSGMRFASYNRYLKRYIAFQAAGDGFQLSASSGADLTKWQRKTEKLYPAVTNANDWTVNNWNYGGDAKRCKDQDGAPSTYPCKQLYAYTSVVGLKNDGERTGEEFYLYYVKRYPGQNFEDGRYLLRRKVKLSYGSTPETKQASRVELNTYEDSQGNQRITTELPEPWLGYRFKSRIGYLASSSVTGYDPLFECRTSTGKYYTTRLITPEVREDKLPVESPDIAKKPPTFCRGGDTLVRRIGWASKDTVSKLAIYDIPSSTTAGVSGQYANDLGWALRSLK